MATFTDEHNAILDTTPHPSFMFPSEPKSPSIDPAPSKEYLLSYLRNRTPPLLRPCRYSYTIHDYTLLPHLKNLYPTLSPQEKLCLHLLYPASATAHLVTSSVHMAFTRVLIAARRRACGEMGDVRERSERAALIIRFLMTCHSIAGIDRALVNSALGGGGVKAIVKAGELVGGDKVLENGLTEVEMIRGMGGVLHQVLVGAEIVDRGGYVRIERRAKTDGELGKKIGKRAGSGVDEIGEGVDVEATLRRLAISEAQERGAEEDTGVWDLMQGTEGGVYDDEVDDAVLEGETALTGLAQGAGEEVEEEPVERHSRAGPATRGASTSSARGGGQAPGRGRGQGRGRGRGRGRGGRGRGARKNAAVRKRNGGM